MFMTFIAISILTAVFITMYLYLIRTHTMASEAERIYAEAAQERIKAVVDELHGKLKITNVGGVGVIIKYLFLLRENDALVEGPIDLPLSPGEEASIDLPAGWTPLQEGHSILVLTERGSRFIAELPSAAALGLLIKFETSELSISRGGVASTDLVVEASEDYPEWQINLVVGFSNCTMENDLTGYDCFCYWWFGLLRCICLPGGASFTYQYSFIEKVTLSEYSFTVTPGMNKKITLTIYASDVKPWVSDVSCHIWVKALNATTGTTLASAGLKVTTQ